MPHARRVSTAGARSSIGVLVALALSCTLVACTPVSLGQRAWEKRLDAADGIEDASWRFYNGWPTTSSRYTAEIETSPDLTEEQAREIARLSCDGAPRLDELDARTSAQDGRWNATKYGLLGSCFAADELVRYARVLESLNASGSALRGEVVVFTFDPERPRREGADSDTLDLTAETTSAEALFTLLREIRSRNSDVALSFRGSVDSDGSTITNEGAPIDLLVPAEFDLEGALPLLERAYSLQHRGLSFTPEGITVSPATVAMISDPATLALQAAAEQAGVRFTVSPPGGEPGEQHGEAYGALTTALASIPGITSVELPKQSSGSETKIRANDDQAIAAALELIAGAEDVDAEFYIEGPPDTMFVRVMRDAQHNSGMPEAFQDMLQAKQSVPHAGYVALIVYSDRIRMRFDLDEAATDADVDRARSDLLRVIEESAIDDVSLHPPYPAPWEDLEATP